MSSKNKKKPRKTKLVPRVYVENEDEAATGKQMSSIRITDVKSVAAESFESLHRTPVTITKTYPSKVSLSKLEASLSSSKTLAYRVSQSNTKRITIVSKLKSPVSVVSQINTAPTIVSKLKTQASLLLHHKTIPTVVSELKTSRTLVSQPKTIPTVVSELKTSRTLVSQPKTIPTVVSELKAPASLLLQTKTISTVSELKTPGALISSKTIPIGVSDMETPATTVSCDTTSTLVSKLEAQQATSNMPFRMSVDVEVEEFDDDDRLQIDESAFEDREIKMEVEDIEKLETEMQNQLKKSVDRITFDNIVIKQERLSPDRGMEVSINTDMQIDIPANVIMRNEKGDSITTYQYTDGVNSNKNNVHIEHISVNENKNNVETKQKNNSKRKNVKPKQINRNPKQNVNLNRDNVNSNESNVNTNKNNVNSNENNVNPNENNVNPNENNVNPNENNLSSNQFTDQNVITNLLVNNQISNDPNSTNQYSVNEEQILSISEKILTTSKNIADKILAIEAKNIIGRIIKEKDNEINPIDSKIQYALDDWKNWTAGSRRPPPLLYKCYICIQSWWHLSNFREHLINHTEPNIKVSVEETSVEECNIISYTDMVPEMIDIETDGICWRCGNDFDIHKLSNRQSECFYTCKKCLKQFSSCTGLREHEYSSPCCRIMLGTWKCYLCPKLSPTPGERRVHMLQKHSVRTDVPIPTSYKRCNDCGSKYFIYNMHNCRNKICSSQCNFCFRKFTHRLLAELHMTIGNSDIKCRICYLDLPKKCMELEHVLMHSTTFIFPYKCITCEEFNVYLDEEVSMQHRYIKHKQKNDKKRNYFDKVLVPISCVLPTYISPENEMQRVNSDVNEHHSITELPLIPEIKLEVMDEEQVDIEQEPEELIIKEENISDEEYEDDIIRLNYEHDAEVNRKKPKIYNCRKCPFKGIHRVFKEHLLTKCGRINTVMRQPKVYSCCKCNFQGHHSVYKEHLKSDCSKHSFVNEDVYTCTKCGSNFDSIKTYLAHFSAHHYEYQQCPVCMNKYQSFSTFIIHFNSHVRQNYIKMYSIQCNDDASQRSSQFSVCKMCSEEVSFEDRFVHWERHLNLNGISNIVLMTNETLPASDDDEPNDVEKNGSGLKPHMLDLLIENLQCDKKRIRECPQCFRVFNRNNDCKRHYIEHLLSDAYSKWRKYYALQCQICGQHFKKADKYKRHMRDHGCLPIFQCEVCDKAFSDSSNFTKHKKVHNMKVLICDLCGKKFQAKLSLIKHMEMHKVSKPVTCTICLKEFPTDSFYRRHMRTKHDNTINKKNYSCSICKEKFYTCKEKWEHLWEEHKERSYKADCNVCGKSFRTYMALKRHDKLNMCGIPKRKSLMKQKTFQFDNNIVLYVNNGDNGYVNTSKIG